MPRAAAAAAAFACAASAGVPDEPGAPPLDADAGAFAAFHATVAAGLRAQRDSGDWAPVTPPLAGMNLSQRRDDETGCPLLRGSIELPGCALPRAARFIVTDLAAYQSRWDAKLVARAAARELPLANGSQAVTWLVYDTDLLEKRGYYVYDGWQWDSAARNALEDASASAWSGEAPPANMTSYGPYVRMAGRQWKRLSAAGPNATRYEVLQVSDIKGIVPCGLTLSGQVSALADEVAAYRRLIPLLPP